MTKKKSSIAKDPFASREAQKYENPIPSREFILGHLTSRGQPATYQELVKELSLSGEEALEALRRRIKAMLRDNQLERLREGYFWPAGKRILVSGRVQIEKGKVSRIWVIPDDNSPRILLSQNETQGLYHGNRVIVSTVDVSRKHVGIRQGHLIEITAQQRLVVSGRFVEESGFCYVMPHGKEIAHDILIPQGKTKTAKDGDIVVVELAKEPSRWSEPLGTVIEVLGHEDKPGVEIEAAIHTYGLPEVWPEEVKAEILSLTENVPLASKRGRLDLRHLPLVTIDGEDAKDFDDAVYCETRPRGGYRLYVAIADVSAYVRPGTALDKEAQLRGNSVYFPGKVIPMLPEVLSNGLCSLKPEVDRLCMVCIMQISSSGKITQYEFHEALMKSHARLTYTKVATLLANQSEKLKEQYHDLLPHLRNLEDLYKVLRLERETRGAIEFETIETRIIFGENGKISRIEPVHRNDAHRIIEECMLAANVATARFLKKNKLPGLYRIHEGPPPDKLADLRIFLGELGLSLGGGKIPEPIDYAKLLKSVQERSDANVIQTVLLRSLSQAVYSPDNIGHFGLAYPSYAHFTSPIRRYPDLLIHRQIRMFLKGQWTEKTQQLANKEEAKADLLGLGNHTSTTERRADEATRDAVRWLKCQYIHKHVGETFEGIISGVTRFGFFVELKDIFIDGLVHITSLQDDYYIFDATHHRLVGEHTGMRFRLGDSVTVKVIKVDAHERKIDFELVGSQSRKEKQTPKKREPKHGQRGQGRPKQKPKRRKKFSSKRK